MRSGSLHPHEVTEPSWSELFRFTIFLPEQHMTCMIRLTNKPSRNMCRLEVYTWDDTAHLPQRFPYSYQNDAPQSLAPDLTNLCFGDVLRLRWSERGVIRLEFTDHDACQLDLYLHELHAGHQQPTKGSYTASERPMSVSGSLRLPGWDVEINGYAMLRRAWGVTPTITTSAFGCSAVGPDLWFHARAARADVGASRYLEGYVYRDGVGAVVQGADRRVERLLDGYPFDIRLTLVDELGRITVAHGATGNAGELLAHPQSMTTASLTEWTVEATSAWGGDWEAMTLSHRRTKKADGLSTSKDGIEIAESALPDVHDPAAPLLAATREFYRAVELADFDRMQRLWERSKRVTCVHPGGTLARGWDEVAAGWQRVLYEPRQIVLSNVSVGIEGNLATVHLDCDVVRNTVPASPPRNHVATTTYVRTKGRWLIIAHHVSGVTRR